MAGDSVLGYGVEVKDWCAWIRGRRGPMGLNGTEREPLGQVARDSVDPDAVLRLFGGSLDDARKGGDSIP